MTIFLPETLRALTEAWIALAHKRPGSKPLPYVFTRKGLVEAFPVKPARACVAGEVLNSTGVALAGIMSAPAGGWLNVDTGGGDESDWSHQDAG